MVRSLVRSLVRTAPSAQSPLPRPRPRLGLTPRRFLSSLAQLPSKTGPQLVPLERAPSAVACGFTASHARLHWPSPPRTVLVVTKQRDRPALDALRAAAQWLADNHPAMRVLAEHDTYAELAEVYSDLPSNILSFNGDNHQDRRDLERVVDLAITLGGDGTVLRLASLFEAGPVPPVLSFSMGTLGFLLPHNAAHLPQTVDMLLKGDACVLLRMRLATRLLPASGSEDQGRTIHVMNEIALHRGRSGHMTTMDSYVNGQHLTRAIADGLIVSTPTGSTAYSLSAGGPIVHPCVQTLVLTPISPRSLSFRTVLLPPDTRVKLVVAAGSRAAADLSLDGRYASTLQQGDGVEVQMSPYAMPCIYFSPRSVPGAPAAHSREQDTWVRDINNLLRFNVSFAGRGLLADACESSSPGEDGKAGCPI